MRRTDKEKLINWIIEDQKNATFTRTAAAAVLIIAIIFISLLIKAGYEFLSK